MAWHQSVALAWRMAMAYAEESVAARQIMIMRAGVTAARLGESGWQRRRRGVAWLRADGAARRAALSRGARGQRWRRHKLKNWRLAAYGGKAASGSVSSCSAASASGAAFCAGWRRGEK